MLSTRKYPNTLPCSTVSTDDDPAASLGGIQTILPDDDPLAETRPLTGRQAYNPELDEYKPIDERGVSERPPRFDRKSRKWTDSTPRGNSTPHGTPRGGGDGALSARGGEVVDGGVVGCGFQAETSLDSPRAQVGVLTGTSLPSVCALPAGVASLLGVLTREEQEQDGDPRDGVPQGSDVYPAPLPSVRASAAGVKGTAKALGNRGGGGAELRPTNRPAKRLTIPELSVPQDKGGDDLHEHWVNTSRSPQVIDSQFELSKPLRHVGVDATVRSGLRKASVDLLTSLPALSEPAPTPAAAPFIRLEEVRNKPPPAASKQTGTKQTEDHETRAVAASSHRRAAAGVSDAQARRASCTKTSAGARRASCTRKELADKSLQIQKSGKMSYV